MSRASLGVADCGKRLSIADEGLCRQQDRPESATRSVLKGREKDGCTNRPSVLYHISYSWSSQRNNIIIQIYEKCKSPFVTPSHIM